MLKKYDRRFDHVLQGLFLYLLEVSGAFDPLINYSGDLIATLQAKLLKLFLVFHHLLKMARFRGVLPMLLDFSCINGSGLDLIKRILNE
jgi:hypothetical protein